jgi:hypothetical protein
LIERLARDCRRLDDRSLTIDIFQGVKTGADQVFKLKRLGEHRYLCKPDQGAAYPVEIEDDIMHPILSGPETKRYITPSSDTYLLFPYTISVGTARLIPADVFQVRFARAWSYLTSWRSLLERRDNGALRDESWYRFSRSQSLERTGVRKFCAAGTVPSLRFAYDENGAFFLTGGRVDGVVPSNEIDPWFLLGTLNGPVCDFVFRRIGRIKQGGWYEANKQFIAPLPIPTSLPEVSADVAGCARRLQQRWTDRSDLLQEATDRLSVLARARHPARWLWPELPTLPEITEQAPSGLRLATDRRKWADERLDEMEAARVEALQAALDRGGRREVRFERGELRLYVSGAVVLEKIYLDEAAGRLAESYWRWLLLSGAAREAERFAADLRRPPSPAVTPAASQFIERVAALAEEVASIAADERALNEILYDLYRLSPDERNLVENEPGHRNEVLAGG